MRIPKSLGMMAAMADIGGVRGALLTRDALSTTVKYDVPIEEVQFAPGDGNTSKITGVAVLKYSCVCNEDGDRLGNPDDTSFSWATGHCLTEEVVYYPLNGLEDSEILANLTKGQYAIDYAAGKIYYCKADDTDVENCSYTVRQQSTQVRSLCENQSSWEVNVYTILSYGTGQQLPSMSIPNGMCLVIRAQPDNTGNVYLSHSKLGAESATNRVQLAGGQAVTLYLANADLVWWNASAASQKIEVYVEVSA